jgi:hypothetical protein
MEQKNQYATQDETPPLPDKQCLNMQQVTGSVLYHTRAVDTTVLIPLNDIIMEQTKATEKTQAATNQRLPGDSPSCHKIDSPPFYTGFNMIVVDGPSTNQTKYKWIIKLLTWTTASCHDLLSQNLWPKPEIKTGQELNTMPMHDVCNFFAHNL